jgi:hypothetical protein
MKKGRKKLSSKSISPKGGAPLVLGLKRFAAISAVEGLKLSKNGRARVSAPISTQQRRAQIIRAYLGPKEHR